MNVWFILEENVSLHEQLQAHDAAIHTAHALGLRVPARAIQLEIAKAALRGEDHAVD